MNPQPQPDPVQVQRDKIKARADRDVEYLIGHFKQAISTHTKSLHPEDALRVGEGLISDLTTTTKQLRERIEKHGVPDRK